MLKDTVRTKTYQQAIYQVRRRAGSAALRAAAAAADSLARGRDAERVLVQR
jgi:hypothetical protein